MNNQIPQKIKKCEIYKKKLSDNGQHYEMVCSNPKCALFHGYLCIKCKIVMDNN